MATRGLLRRGDVVLVPFPFADLSGTKVRPAVIVSADPQSTEIIIAFVTSVLTNRSPLRDDPEFGATGLKVDSLIRADKLVTLSCLVVSRRLGSTGPEIRAKLTSMLRVAFGV